MPFAGATGQCVAAGMNTRLWQLMAERSVAASSVELSAAAPNRSRLTAPVERMSAAAVVALRQRGSALPPVDAAAIAALVGAEQLLASSNRSSSADDSSMWAVVVACTSRSRRP